MQKINWRIASLAAFLTFYTCGGIYTLVRQLLALPFPLSVFMDYNFYSQALARALSGGDMYAIREIGPAFLYPPPALLFVDVLNLLPGSILQGSFFAALNVLMLVVLVGLICKKYSLSPQQTALLLAVSLVFAPFLLTLEMGQINMLTQFGLGLLFIFAISVPWLAGLGLALAIITKVTPVFFLAYLLATKNFKVLIWTGVCLAGFLLLGSLRYGTQPLLTYLEVFQGMSRTIPIGANSQSLAALLAGLGSGANNFVIQFGVTLYLIMVTLVSAWLTFRGGKPEATFIITGLAMMLSPNILWYHHYVFFLLPFLAWISWQREKPAVIWWCLGCMFIIQIEYFLPPGGILVHLIGHLSILIVLIQTALERKTVLIGLQQPQAAA